MIRVSDKIKCTGCASCFHVCPISCITMTPDEEGFLYPVVDENKCIECHKCENVCPVINKIEIKNDYEICYAAYNKSEESREKSSSGGMFIAIARKIFQKNGVVYGAAFDEDFQVKHSSARNEDELDRLLGSKYVQSRMEDIYYDVRNNLQVGAPVLFMGTACQIAGLKSFLGKDYDNLICVDFICLGVPSPRIWGEYLDTFFERDAIRYINFKDKSLGWHTFSLKIEQDDKIFLKNGRETYFFNGYFNGLYSRPSCSDCVFKKMNRVSDMTISDCWGYYKIAPEMDDNKGLSSVIIHNDKGMKVFKSIMPDLVYKKSDIRYVKKYNSNYCISKEIGDNRKEFWEMCNKNSYIEACEKYCVAQEVIPDKTRIERIKEFLKEILISCRKMLKNC